MPAHPIASNGFQPAFYQPYVGEPAPASNVDALRNGPADGPVADGVRYCADRHGSHAAFCQGPDFERYRTEVRRHLDFLAGFCVRHAMADAACIARRYETFFDHRFHTAHYFDTREELVDSAGKQSLDAFCRMVGDETLCLEKRKAAVRELSHGVTQCADGAVASLVTAARELSMTMGGLRARLWATKETVTKGVLTHLLSERFGNEAAYPGNEIHYVNAAWNYVAHDLGLKAIPDLAVPRLDLGFLDECRHAALRALAPDRMAREIADECLERLASRFPRDREGAPKRLDAALLERLDEAMEAIRGDLGLRSDQLPLRNLVELVDDGFRLHDTPSLIAVDFMRAMDGMGLLTVQPQLHGCWRDASGTAVALYTCGDDVAWVAYAQGAPAPQGTPWDDHVDIAPLTLPALLQWHSAHGAKGEPPAQRFVREAIVATDPSRLPDMPAAWLRDADGALRLLERMGSDRAGCYLRANLRYFMDDFPVAHRAALIDRAMGMGPAALALADAWYGDITALLQQPRGRNDISRLQLWMEQDNAAAIDAAGQLQYGRLFLSLPADTQATAIFRTLRGDTDMPLLYRALRRGSAGAIAGWQGLLRRFSTWPAVRHRMHLLFGSDNPPCTAALAHALARGHGAAIRAFHAAVRDPAVKAAIEHGTPAQPNGPSWDGPGLWKALGKGDTDAVDAFVALMADPGTPGPVQAALAPILDERDTVHAGGSPGLWRAMNTGDVKAIQAFRHVLGKVGASGKLGDELPRLLAARNAHGIPALAQAVAKNQAAAVDAYRAMLADEAVNPCIRHALPDLLGAQGPTDPDDGAPGGRAVAIVALHALLRDPGIAAHIVPSLPGPLAGRPGELTPIAQVLDNAGDAKLLRSLHGLLVDPAILPGIRHALPRLLGSSRWDSRTLWRALATGNVDFIEALHGFLADPAVTPQIQDDLSRLLRGGSLLVGMEARTYDARATAAARAFLNDPAIFPHVARVLPEFMKRPPQAHAARDGEDQPL